MSNFRQFCLYMVVGFIAINVFGYAFCRGTSYPHPVPKTVVYTAPFSVP